jgi:XTP/dITP diphosphohydrolase
VSLLLVATRSAHKLAELRTMVGHLEGLRLVDLDGAEISPSPQEEEIEAFASFEENALAKARHFSRLTGFPVLADDSGLCVDALRGRPGVFSKRFSGRSDLAGAELDEANNRRLLHELCDVAPADRTARYVCMLALRTPDGREDLFRGTVEGTILHAPRGTGGFGYDPLFFLPSVGATFAEVTPETKNRLSHRGSALIAALPRLRELAAS